jgi:hypothetical protein
VTDCEVADYLAEVGGEIAGENAQRLVTKRWEVPLRRKH